MQLMVLNTGIFPDRETVGQALLRLEGEHGIVYADVSSPEIGELDWDLLLRQLLAADRIIVV